MGHNKSVTGLVVLAVSLIAGSGHAEVYKWKDKKGVLHFGDQPPAEKYEEVKIRKQSTFSNAPAVSAAKRKEVRKKQVEKLLAGFEAKKEAEAAEKKQDEKQKNTRNKNCSDAKKELFTTESANILYHRKDDGSKIYLSESQRKKLIGIHKADIKKYCK